MSPDAARREDDQNFQKKWANNHSDIRYFIHRVEAIMY
jgi:hypothetical protein